MDTLHLTVNRVSLRIASHKVTETLASHLHPLFDVTKTIVDVSDDSSSTIRLLVSITSIHPEQIDLRLNQPSTKDR